MHASLLKIAFHHRYFSKNFTISAEQQYWKMHQEGWYWGQLYFGDIPEWLLLKDSCNHIFVLEILVYTFYIFFLWWGNSMSNHPIFFDVDTLTSQILFIFSLFVYNVQMINPWKFQPSTPYGSKVIGIWKFDQNECSRVKSTILNLCFL